MEQITKNHIVKAKVRRYDREGNSRLEEVEDLDVEYDLDGNIISICAYSEHFVDWVPVQLEFFKDNYPGRFEKLEEEVRYKLATDIREAAEEFRFFDLHNNR